MKKILLTSLISLNFFLSFSQNTISSSQYTLWGEFIITKTYLPGISGMTNNESKLWVGKRVEFHDSIYLQIDNQSIYKNDFEFSHCMIKKNYNVKKYSSNEFYQNNNFLPKELGILEQYVRYISLDYCAGTPFSEILIKSNGNLIIGWDGVQFELTRLKRN